MRITREFILKFTHEAIERRTRSNREVMAAYLCGSFLDETFTLGGAGDVDLFVIHSSPPEVAREVVRMTDDIHLDIAHHDQRDYRDTRRLRVDPWLGPALNACKVLYDPQHFMDFVQASVRGQFDRTDHIYQRSRPLADQARETWFQLRSEPDEPGPKALAGYLTAVGKSANAIASLVGPPLSQRRLLLEYLPRAETLERPGLYQGLLGLLGAPKIDPGAVKGWLSAWVEAYQALPEAERPVRFHAARLNYYLSAFREMIEIGQPFTLLWPMLTTWTELVRGLPAESPHLVTWKEMADKLGLYGPGLEERMEALDAYLDTVDETLESWAQVNGAWETA